MAITELLSSALATGILAFPTPYAQANLPSNAEINVEAPSRKGWVIYTVQPGDTLSEIAQRYRVSPRDIMYSSGLEGVSIKPGQSLRIPLVDQQQTVETRLPPGVRTYTIRAGDTVQGVAARFDLTVLGLVSANPGLKSLDRLEPGSNLFIPTDIPGLILRLGQGQTIQNLASKYGLSVAEVAEANGLANPTALKAGDLVLLPGVQARTTYDRLLKIRDAEAQAKVAEDRRLAAERRQREIQRQEEAARQQQEQRRQQQLQAQQQSRQQAQARERQQTSQARLRRANAVVAAAGYRWPVSNFVITSYFGRRGAYQRYHTGVDLAAPYGTPIYASRAGQVETAGWSRVGYGIHVILDHGRSVETLYGHMSRMTVRSGQWVERGQLIGYVGSTGWSTGPHVHFEVRVGGGARNPLAYLP